MSGFQKGDVRVDLDGQNLTLRLTLGALAELSERLLITGPKALQCELTSLNLAKARIILECLNVGEKTSFTDAQILQLLPNICEVFEYAFT